MMFLPFQGQMYLAFSYHFLFDESVAELFP